MRGKFGKRTIVAILIACVLLDQLSERFNVAKFLNVNQSSLFPFSKLANSIAVITSYNTNK